MREKITVLECIRQGQVGGGESHLLSLVSNLDKNRFVPVVLSFTGGPMVEQLKSSGVETHVIPTTRPFDVTRWGAVKSMMRNQKIDVVHAHGTRAASNVYWAAAQLGVPLMYTVHGWSFHDDQHPLIKNLRIQGEKFLTRRSQINVCVSQSNHQTGIKNIPGFQSIVIPNGIDHNKFNPTLPFPDIRAELGIGYEATLVLFVARFIHQKQPLKLLEAFDRAVDRNANLSLLMVGEGDQRKEAEAWVRSRNVPNVFFQPFRQDVPALLRSADIFVLPSLWEGLPIGLLEAMAMERAVIATQVDGTREIIEHEQNGLLISTQSLVDELEKQLLRLATDKQLRLRLGVKARSTIGERFSAAAMTQRIEELYVRLVQSGSFAKR